MRGVLLLFEHSATAFDYAKWDCCLAAYGGVVLQLFEFTV